MTITVFGVDALRLRRDVGNDGASLETDFHNLQVAEGNVNVLATRLRSWLRGDDSTRKCVCTLKYGTCLGDGRLDWLVVMLHFEVCISEIRLTISRDVFVVRVSVMQDAWRVDGICQFAAICSGESLWDGAHVEEMRHSRSNEWLSEGKS